MHALTAQVGVGTCPASTCLLSQIGSLSGTPSNSPGESGSRLVTGWYEGFCQRGSPLLQFSQPAVQWVHWPPMQRKQENAISFSPILLGSGLKVSLMSISFLPLYR